MAASTHDINELKRRMQGALSVLKTELAGLRTGRASAHLLDPIQVEAYGLSPATEGQVIRLRIPELNEDRRKELVKVAHKYAEAARVAVRHVRRDGLDVVKKLEKDHDISKDDHDRFSGDIQKVTDGTISEIDQMLGQKEKEILTV